MIPSEKSPEIDNLLAGLGQLSGNKRDRHTAITTGQCIKCDTPNLEFRTGVDRKEYTISGWCQNCQDEIFGGSK